MTETGQTTTPRRAAFVFIFITVVLDMLALGMIVPVLPKLVEDFVGGNTARAAEIYGLFGTVWALMQFVFSPVLGAMSDRFGRRPVILLSNLGLGLDYIVMAIAPGVGWPVDRLRVHRGRYAAGKARRRVRHDERCIRPRLRRGTGDRRRAGQYRSAPAFLGRGGIQFSELRIRSVRAARVAVARASRTIFMAARESARLAEAAAIASRTVWTRDRQLRRQHRARSAANHFRAVRDVSLWMERTHRRTGDRGGWPVLGGRRRRLGRASGRAFRRASHHARRIDLRHGRFPNLWNGFHRCDLLVRASTRRLVGTFGAADARHDDAARRRVGAGTTSGRAQQSARNRVYDWSARFHQRLRELHRRESRLAFAGCAVSAGVVDDRRFNGDGVANDALEYHPAGACSDRCRCHRRINYSN